MSIYRKLYEDHFGPIPKDKNGRSYEIHHIDGNHKNNHISNLICVSIEEHYKIHLSQGDWWAALMISKRMKVSPEEQSFLIKHSNKKRISNGTHNFTSDLAKQRVKNGTNPFVYLAKVRHENGTNHLTKKVKCENCNKLIDGGNYRRWHGNKCKLNVID